MHDPKPKNSEKTFECPICNIKLSNENGLRTHTKTHQDISIHCDRCPKKFRNAIILRKHEKRAHQQKAFHLECDSCERTFSTNYQLRLHVEKVHLKISKHKCNQCNKEMHSPSQLQIHIKSKHEGMKFECHLCNTLFSQMNYINRHMKIVHQETSKDYKCDICFLEYKNKGSLTLHINRVHNRN